MVPNGATLVLLPPVTTGSEEDPGAQPDDWTQGLRLSLEGIRGGTVEDHFLMQLLPVLFLAQMNGVKCSENGIWNPEQWIIATTYVS